MKRAIFLPGKAPRPGQTKTRLSPPLSPEQAATVYRGFLQDSVALAVSLGWERVTLTHPEPPETERELARLVPAEVHFLPQRGADFGAVLSGGFGHHFDRGFDRVVLIGSDNPTLPAAVVEDAARALDDHDLVIGPSTDGGYYLLGMAHHQPRLFEEIAWSTDVVYEQTLERARRLRLRVATVLTWYDVDTVAELERLRRDLAALPPSVAPATRAVLAELSW